MWRRALVLLTAMGMALAAPAPPHLRNEQDLKRMQGAWQVQRCVVNGEEVPNKPGDEVTILIKGDRWEYTGRNSSRLAFPIVLDATREPRGIIRIWKDGKPQRGLYKFNGDTLTIILAGIGEEWPKDFTLRESVLYVFRRVKK
jgi:uncharacterized protein (TIGR03067 family)